MRNENRDKNNERPPTHSVTHHRHRHHQHRKKWGSRRDEQAAVDRMDSAGDEGDLEEGANGGAIDPCALIEI